MQRLDQCNFAEIVILFSNLSKLFSLPYNRFRVLNEQKESVFTQVNRMSKSRRVLAIGGKQRSFGLHMVCFEMVLYHNEPH